MLRVLSRGLAAWKPDPHLASIASSKSPSALYHYLSQLPTFTLSQQTLSFKILSRFLRESNGKIDVFDHPVYQQMKRTIIPQFKTMTASQTLDVLFWARVCKQNGKQELSNEELQALLQRVDELSRNQGYTFHGLTSVYLNLVLLSKRSAVVDEVLEEALVNPQNITFIDLKQLLVGIVNSVHWRKNLISRTLSALHEYDWNHVPFHRIREVYHLLQTMEPRDTALVLYNNFNRLVEAFCAKIPTASNQHLLELLNEFRSRPLLEKALLSQSFASIENRIKDGTMTQKELVAYYDTMVHLQSNPWLGLNTQPIIEKIHAKLVGMDAQEDMWKSITTSMALSRLKIPKKYKENALKFNQVDSLKVADGEQLLPQEEALIASVTSQVPQMSLSQALTALEAASMALNPDAPLLSALISTLKDRIASLIERNEQSILGYFLLLNECLPHTKSVLKPITKEVFATLSELFGSLTDIPFVLWKSLSVYSCMEAEWQGMIESVGKHITNTDILKIMRLMDNDSPFAPILGLMTVAKEQLADETILHAAKFLYYPQTTALLFKYLSLITQLRPDCVFTESYRYNFKRLFQLIKLQPESCFPLLHSIRDCILAQP